MSRKNYSPALSAVYLNQESQLFLSANLNFDLWKLFFGKIERLFPGLFVHILVSFELKNKLNDYLQAEKRIILHSDCDTEDGFLKVISKLLPASTFNDPDWDEVCLLYFKGISPLLDTALMTRGWERHKEYFSQYSYSENLPEGVIPTIITREFLATLPDHLKTDVHSFFLKNINHYDVDIFFVPPDLRQYRLDFRINDARNLNLIQNLLTLNPSITYDEILPAIKTNPIFFRYAPSYIEWEIYKGCKLDCLFCPRTIISKENDFSYYSLPDVVTTLKKFESAFNTPMTFCLGGNGEPFLHPQWKKVIIEILKYSLLKELIIETALYENTAELIEFLRTLNEKEKAKLCFIINLSTLKEERYEKLYGKNLLKNILADIDKLKEVLPPSSLHIQMIKMQEVSDEIDAYFTFFEKKGINVILQKYNSFAGKMRERRVSDLTPIHREFCWHLNRDLYLNVDGAVSICKQSETEILGNVILEEISDIWEKGLKHFSNSLSGNHSDIPAPCLNCDEWYTFNA